ncbi:hypothetical protein [Actinomadura rudentiformis]|uniref:SMI1/KNR4 family protein n=1 Tax=Actinomadura rudentiformis TaxID=359158 RepID=A0A6H9YM07_9ACTN|nr:hypothetical protein [Actinomadura rudentiformis]KAB2347742.1 hypothetical protein F8566_17680 [Actinomadura rudentiformis]
MTEQFDLAGELTAACRDRAQTSRFLRRFAAEWSTPIADGDGCRQDELSTAEQRLDVQLPEALKEVMTLFGRREDLTSNQDYLLKPDQLHYDETGRALVWRHENQGVAHWGIPVEHLRLPDPPVIFQLDGTYYAPEPWRPFLGRFSLASIEMVLYEALFASDNDDHDNREASEADLGILERRYSRLPIPDYPMWANPEGPPIRWFYDRDVLICDHGTAWLWVRTRNPEALVAVRAVLPGDWHMAY